MTVRLFPDRFFRDATKPGYPPRFPCPGAHAMLPAGMPRTRINRRRVPAVIALLALLGLFARGMTPAAPGMSLMPGPTPVDRAVIAALGGTLCHDGDPGPASPDTPKHGADCLLCPLCGPAGTPAFLPAEATPLPLAKPRPRLHWAIAGPPRAPPPRPLIAAQPRGPPILV